MAQDRAKEGVRLPYVLRHFDVSYLGICAPHVWICCVAHRAGLDFGGVVIGIPLYIALSAFMLAVMLLAWKGKAQRVAPKLDWPLAALQAAATLLLVVPLPVTGAASATAAAVAAGIGVAWLYLQWAPFYAKLDVREAIACIFCAMAVGSALKVPIDLLPPVPAAVVLMALPFASAALARRAQRKQPPAEREPRMFYDQNPTSIPWKILFGVAAYSLIIGVIQGMPIQADYTPFWMMTFSTPGTCLTASVSNLDLSRSTRRRRVMQWVALTMLSAPPACLMMPAAMAL